MRSVLITGTSSGIGLATAVELANRNWDVVATMRDPTRLGQRQRQLLSSAKGDRIRTLPLDVTDDLSINSVIEAINLTNRPLDGVVQNAGIAAGGAFEDLDDALVRSVMETNFFGVLALTRALLPAFRAQRHGRIVIVSSEAAFAGQPANSIYCASKWALEGWAEAMAYELEPFGIRITLIEPGPYRTNIWASSPRIVPEHSAYRPLSLHLNAAVDAHVKKTARDPREVARVIATALAAERPRFRYAVGPLARLGHFMRGKVPSSIVRKVVRRYLGLNQVRC